MKLYFMAVLLITTTCFAIPDAEIACEDSCKEKVGYRYNDSFTEGHCECIRDQEENTLHYENTTTSLDRIEDEKFMQAVVESEEERKELKEYGLEVAPAHDSGDTK